MKQRKRERVQLKFTTKADSRRALWEAMVRGQKQLESAERQGSDDSDDSTDNGIGRRAVVS